MSMHAVLLPGHSPINKDWIEAIDRSIKHLFKSTFIHYYDHWSKDGSFKITTEREKLKTTVHKLDNYLIIAKSVGVFFAINSVEKQIIAPKACIFTGTTKRSAPMLQNWSIPTLFIQESSDPFMSFQELNNSLDSTRPSNYQILETAGSNHSYSDIDGIASNIESFLKDLPSK